MKKQLHEHNTELYERVSTYMNNQSAENAVALVEWAQREGGKFTGYYPTNFVSQADIETQTGNKDIAEQTPVPSHEEMKELAEFIGENDTENGTYWLSLQEWCEEIRKT